MFQQAYASAKPPRPTGPAMRATATPTTKFDAEENAWSSVVITARLDVERAPLSFACDDESVTGAVPPPSDVPRPDGSGSGGSGSDGPGSDDFAETSAMPGSASALGM